MLASASARRRRAAAMRGGGGCEAGAEAEAEAGDRTPRGAFGAAARRFESTRTACGVLRGRTVTTAKADGALRQGAQGRASGGVSSFALKIVAIVAMTANHAAYVFLPYLPDAAIVAMFSVGGLTFPIMAFLLVEGYRHTSSVKRYAARLFAFALVSQIPYGLFLGFEANVLFTLLAGLAILWMYDHMGNRALFWLLFCAIVLVSACADWGVAGPIVILIMGVYPDRRRRVAYALIVPIVGFGLPALSDFAATGAPVFLGSALYAFAGCSAAIPLLLSYKGRRGYPLKWFFYAFYPAHIALLGIARVLAFGA